MGTRHGHLSPEHSGVNINWLAAFVLMYSALYSLWNEWNILMSQGFANPLLNINLLELKVAYLLPSSYNSILSLKMALDLVH